MIIIVLFSSQLDYVLKKIDCTIIVVISGTVLGWYLIKLLVGSFLNRSGIRNAIKFLSYEQTWVFLDHLLHLLIVLTDWTYFSS